MKIIGAMSPWRYEDDYTIITLKVWFEEFDHPFESFAATLFDCEGHGRELWFRAMKGEYGEIKVVPANQHPRYLEVLTPEKMKTINAEPARMLTHDHHRPS